ncbi:MAG: MATE family efflux transporter [Clostridia bacterium]|nr:MATE family efflux transporter [Clostridia bacterium]
MLKHKSPDLLTGNLWVKILIFSFPLMLSNILQLLYSAADTVVVGRFAGNDALAAVGSTGSLTNLFINLFIGFSVGASVIVAQGIGAKDDRAVHETVHTSMLLALIGGVIIGGIGVFAARPLLAAMDNKVLDLASLYLRIIFAGAPFNMVYNFGAAIIRARGNTRLPLYILAGSGLLNVGLNLLFVILFHMSVAGVALATILSQALSAVLMVLSLMHSHDATRLQLRALRFYPRRLASIVRVGLPAGIQSSLFAVSNVLIQSSVNSFGSNVMAGNTAAANISDFIYMAMNALYHAAVTFAGQHAGAGLYRRIGRVAWQCVVTTAVVGIALGALLLLFGPELLSIYDTNAEATAAGMVRMRILCSTYFLCGIMDVFMGLQRGLGSSLRPMIVSLCGACGLRIVWIYTAFRAVPTLDCLFFSYPFTWLVTGSVHLFFFLLLWRKKVRTLEGVRGTV